MKLFRSRLTEERRKKFWIPPVAKLPEPSEARKAAEAPMKPARAYRLPESLMPQNVAPKRVAQAPRQPQVIAAE
ncbi:hypothetical protein [Methyloligella solikamskensis]|uniref:Uncharacterized protein n=1 Tax=Methyloligella solikamskensis TaxID=1177756 RepID=A0ABW3JFR4_9HYPH